MKNWTHTRQVGGKILLYLVLTAGAIVMIFPLYTGVVTSLLGPDNISTYPPKLYPVELRWQNYIDATRQAGKDQLQYHDTTRLDKAIQDKA